MGRRARSRLELSDELLLGGVRHWIVNQPIGVAISLTARRGAETRTLRVIVGPSLAPP